MLDQPLAAAIRGDGGPVDGQDDYQYPCQDCFAAFKDQVNRSCRDVCSLQIDSTSQAGASLHPRQNVFTSCEARHVIRRKLGAFAGGAVSSPGNMRRHANIW